MRLQIVHRTRYRYSAPVSESYNEVRLQPVSDGTQECLAFQLTTTPHVRTERYRDFNLNLVDHFHVSEEHTALDIVAQSEVTKQPGAPTRDDIRFPRSQLVECMRLERCYDFLQGSTYVRSEVDLWRRAQDITVGFADAWDATLAIMAHIHREFVYDAGSTTVNTRADEVWHDRRGVCQDFAHVMIGLCRSVQIPARYVSGYLYVGEKESLRGNLASHAWVEVYLPGHGWLGLDPTNNRPADEHHVKVAVGRDYADAAPLRGNFRGLATQELAVDLRIERLDDSGGAGF